jgi:hypothetical protein
MEIIESFFVLGFEVSGFRFCPPRREIASPVRYRSCLISTSSSCRMTKLTLRLMTENFFSLKARKTQKGIATQWLIATKKVRHEAFGT